MRKRFRGLAERVSGGNHFFYPDEVVIEQRKGRLEAPTSRADQSQFVDDDRSRIDPHQAMNR